MPIKLGSHQLSSQGWAATAHPLRRDYISDHWIVVCCSWLKLVTAAEMDIKIKAAFLNKSAPMSSDPSPGMCIKAILKALDKADVQAFSQSELDAYFDPQFEAD